ncbi:MAG: type III polyketide synthase [Deltaproteobacteria bacterium]|nr:type III polyketide synthase [Deltaproteobacteria bacterium]
MPPPPAPSILGAASALPGPGASQQELLKELELLWSGRPIDWGRLERIHRATRVERRHFALPLSKRKALISFSARNRFWQEEAAALAERALVDALARANLAPQDLDHLFLVTSTGVALPGLDARLANRLRLKDVLVRWPLAGFGCLGGGAGLVRATEVLHSFPEQTAALLAVELFSCTLQLEDLSDANLIATGLFGDGAGAVVLGGGERPRTGGPRVVATRSVLFPDTEWVMGWDVRDTGFGVVLSEKVPALVRSLARGPVDSFLASVGMRRGDVRHWIVHPGGPKVLQALQSALELPEGALRHSWLSLAQVGNLSAASVLHVLCGALDEGEAHAGEVGLVLAFGPGFGAELALLRW